MIVKSKRLSYLLAMNIILASSIIMPTTTYAQGLQPSLDWSIETSKKTFYPGEPVLLTLKIQNTGQQKEDINFGAGGIGAFSMEICDRSNQSVAKGNKIQRFGFSIFRPTKVSPGKTAQKPIVLNQWCTTVLPPAQYNVICRVDYRLRSEIRNHKAGPIHVIQLELDIEVVKMDDVKFKQILEDLANREIRKHGQSKGEWLRERRIAREMLAFTESPLAVPYQLHILKFVVGTWLKRDVINSLARSGNLEAAVGLMQIINENKDCPQCIKDVKRELIYAIYRLRETGKSDIINATDEFVAKYKRPVLAKPAD